MARSLIALLLFGLLELLVWERLVPPAVRPADAPASEFSAARAAQVLERLLAEAEPHPTGSVAQERVRARLLAELEQLGLKPELESGVACSPEGVCAELHNVLAELPGAGLPGSRLSGIGQPEPVSRVLLSAHYDSVPSGPGAGDDGQSVATLIELARALRAAPAQSGAWLLFTDGEELGLLGARLFAAEHPLLGQLRVSLNLEARGDRGPSLMFETGDQSGAVVRSYAHSPRPAASSLFTPVYRSLPNDTDFSIFLRQGLEGINLAFVGGVENYHTPHDTLERLDWRSSQQQGDAALATLRALDPEAASTGAARLVYFDVLTAGLVTLPAGLMLPFAGLGLACFALALGRELRERRNRLQKYGRAALALLLGWGVPVLLTALIGTLLELVGGLPFAVVSTPQPFVLGVLLLVAGGQALALSLLATAELCQALWDVSWLCWLLLGLAIALVLPGASYLLVLPGLAAGLIRLGHQLCGAARVSAAGMLVAALFSGLLVLPLLSLCPSTIELSTPVALAVAFALGLSPVAPLLGPVLGHARLRLGLLVGGAALALSELALPAYSAEVPQRLSLVLETGAGESHWLAEGDTGALPTALRAAAEFATRPSRPHPWPGYARGLMYVASAPAPSVPAPIARIRRQGRSLHLELEAPQDLWALGLLFQRSAPIEAAHWQGHAIQSVHDAAGQRVLLVLGDDRSVSVDFDFSSAATELPDVLAIALGLPEAGAALQAARGTQAVASGFGDMTVLHLEPRLEP